MHSRNYCEHGSGRKCDRLETEAIGGCPQLQQVLASSFPRRNRIRYPTSRQDKVESALYIDGQPRLPGPRVRSSPASLFALTQLVCQSDQPICTEGRILSVCGCIPRRVSLRRSSSRPVTMSRLTGQAGIGQPDSHESSAREKTKQSKKCPCPLLSTLDLNLRDIPSRNHDQPDKSPNHVDPDVPRSPALLHIARRILDCRCRRVSVFVCEGEDEIAILQV